MILIAKLTDVGSNTIAPGGYPLTIDDVQREVPSRGWPSKPGPATFEGTPYAVVEETLPPTTSYGEKPVEGPPQKIGDVWLQTWSVQTITVAQAKQQLANLAINIYWEKFLSVPGVTEFQQAGRNGVTVLQARATRFQSAIDSVAARIQAATTIAEAYAIYQELDALS
jgi:hypothetical protein